MYSTMILVKLILNRWIIMELSSATYWYGMYQILKRVPSFLQKNVILLQVSLLQPHTVIVAVLEGVVIQKL